MRSADAQPGVDPSIIDERRQNARRWSLAGVSVLIALLAFLVFLSSSTYSSVLSAPTDGRFRFGVGVAGHKGTIEDYDVAKLRAGWYVDWGVQLDPPDPAGMEYVQMVRLHQMTECWPKRVEGCTYTVPYTYVLSSPQTRSEIVSIARENPGSLWLIGNEMDRRDWGTWEEPGGQDEMLPETYAHAYHDLYHLIKDAVPDDQPEPQIAIGGVVQPTPLRLKYLDRVIHEYTSTYQADRMPVDVWNIHNMILRERAGDYGADIPPGLADTEGRLYTWEDADDVETFQQQILDFRQWMKEKGEQGKPLIISEYSVLYPESYGFDDARVSDYLYATFDYMMSATDSLLGDPDDDDRLVQRWAWYSLNDNEFEGYTSTHHLFDPQTHEITQLGIDYATYPWRQVYLPITLANHVASFSPSIVNGRDK